MTTNAEKLAHSQSPADHDPESRPDERRSEVDILKSFDPSAPQTLSIRYRDWKCKSAVALVDDAVAYTVLFKFRRPQLHFLDQADSRIGNAVLHNAKRRIDLVVRGQSFTLERQASGFSKYAWASPALGGELMQWVGKAGFKNMEFVCLNSKGLPLARLKANCWAFRKIGTCEFSQGELAGLSEIEKAKEEIFMTGFAIAYYALIVVSSGVPVIP